MGSLDVQLPLGSFINLWTLLVGNICLIGINLDAFGETQKREHSTRIPRLSVTRNSGSWLPQNFNILVFRVGMLQIFVA